MPKTGLKKNKPLTGRIGLAGILVLVGLTQVAGLVRAADSSLQKTWYQNLAPEWGGHLRLEGFTSRPATQSCFGPVGTEPYYDGIFDFRLKNKVYLGDWGYFVTHYEAVGQGGDTQQKTNALRKIHPELFSAGLLSAGPISDDRRFFDLTRTLSKDDRYVFYHRLDRLFLAWQPAWGNVRLGRQALTWGNGMLFNPMDLCNPFSPTDFTRDYKVGDDMVYTQVSAGEKDWQFIYVPRRDPDSRDLKWEKSSAAGKLHLAKGTTEFDLMAAKHYQDYVSGLGATGYLGDAAWRINATWTFLQEDYKDRNGYLSLVANLDYSWVFGGKNCYGWIEFYFNGLGQDDYTQALASPEIAERLNRGELFALGRSYLDAQLKVELHPLFNAYLTVIANLHDPSGVWQPRGEWNLTQNSQILFGANLYFGGTDTEYGGVRIPGSDLRTTPAPTAYLWYTYFF